MKENCESFANIGVLLRKTEYNTTIIIYNNLDVIFCFNYIKE